MNDFMSGAGKIINIDPPYGIPGGEIVIDCADFDSGSPSQCSVLFGDTEGQIVALGPRRVLAQVPETKGGEVEVRLKSKVDLSEPASFPVVRETCLLSLIMKEDWLLPANPGT